MTRLVGQPAEVSVGDSGRRRRPGRADRRRRAHRAHRAVGATGGAVAARHRGRDHRARRRFGHGRSPGRRRGRRRFQMSHVGRIFPRSTGRSGVVLGLLGLVRRDGAVRAQLHQGAAVDGRDLLRPQAHAHRREGQPLDGRLPRRPRRRGAAGARCSSRSRTSRSTSSRSRCGSSAPTRRRAWRSRSRPSRT